MERLKKLVVNGGSRPSSQYDNEEDSLWDSGSSSSHRAGSKEHSLGADADYDGELRSSMSVGGGQDIIGGGLHKRSRKKNRDTWYVGNCNNLNVMSCHVMSCLLSFCLIFSVIHYLSAI